MRRIVHEIFIPITRDRKVAGSDGGLHSPETWQWFRELLREVCGGVTVDPDEYEGDWIDEDGDVVTDVSRKYIAGLPEDKLYMLPMILQKAKEEFFQRRIYYQVVGESFLF
jgi:predicted phage-related endonuclease